MQCLGGIGGTGFVVLDRWRSVLAQAGGGSVLERKSLQFMVKLVERW